MSVRLVATFSLVFGLAAGAIARADDKDSKRDAQAPQTIRGTIAAVTLEGELTIDYKTNRAIESDMTMLTIVGLPARDEPSEKGTSEHHHHHHRHNVYVIWLGQGTKVRDSSGQALADKTAQTEPWNALEIGDHVEVEYTPRQVTIPEDHPTRRKHGRHRTYFGDAKSVNILTTPHPQSGTGTSGQPEKK